MSVQTNYARTRVCTQSNQKYFYYISRILYSRACMCVCACLVRAGLHSPLYRMQYFVCERIYIGLIFKGSASLTQFMSSTYFFLKYTPSAAYTVATIFKLIPKRFKSRKSPDFLDAGYYVKCIFRDNFGKCRGIAKFVS